MKRERERADITKAVLLQHPYKEMLNLHATDHLTYVVISDEDTRNMRG
jgi:hypothetical protein